LEEAFEKVREVACEANLPEFGAYAVSLKAREGLLEVEEDCVEFGVGSKGFLNLWRLRSAKAWRVLRLFQKPYWKGEIM